MPDNYQIKKAELIKKIDNVLYVLYPKTSADLVQFDAENTVAAKLLSFANDLQNLTAESTGTIDTRIKASCDELYNKIMGLTGQDTTINEAFDTLKEVADWIDEHGDVVTGFTSDIGGLREDLTDITGRVEALETVVGDAGSGLVKAVADHAAAIAALGGNVEDLHTPQLYAATGDTTDVETALETLGDVAFGDGDVLVITDENGIKAAYQFDANNDTVWGALDGNVSADNVILKSDITLAGAYTAVGNVTKSQNGTGTLSAAGKSLSSVLTNIFTKELQPTKTEPAVSLTFSQAGAYEVGTTVTPSYTASLSAGSYTYGPATGVVVETWAVTDSNAGSKDTATGTFDPITVTDTLSYKITAVATHTDGAVAKTNVGNESSPVVKIAAGSKSKVSAAVTGYRKSFYGSLTSALTDITSANVRALAGSGNSATNTFNVNIVEGAKQVIIAVPAGKTLSKVEDTGAFGTDIVGSFALRTVQVEGANGYVAKNYNTYVYSPSTALGANTYKVTIK